MAQPQELLILSKAERLLAKAQNVDEVKELRNQADAVKVYAKKAKLGQKLIIEASTIKVLAERKLGQILQALPLANAAPGNQYTGPVQASEGKPILLREIGISKAESYRTKQLASLPEEIFQRYLADMKNAGKEPTTAALLRLARKQKYSATANVAPRFHQVVTLRQLVEEDAKFTTIYADPPWPYRNQSSFNAPSRPLSALTLADICNEPVSALTQENAHLHLWTTNAFLREAFTVVEAWGFTFKSCLVWVKPQLGIGNYWRVSHEFLLFGQKGNLPFADNGKRSWIASERTENGKKPPQVRSLIEQVSPPAYLELYGSEPAPNDRWVIFTPEVLSDNTEPNSQAAR
jgi:N6-adenosine-specific RNA methylase IME4